MGTYDILCHGHEGQVSLAINANLFSGTISSPDGSGIVSGEVAADGSLIGTAAMGDHTVGFVASIEGNAISGHLKFGWIPIPFEGTKIA